MGEHRNAEEGRQQVHSGSRWIDDAERIQSAGALDDRHPCNKHRFAGLQPP